MPYLRLGLTLVVSFLLMFLLSMSMVDQTSHFQWNLSNAYLAITMVASMAVVMLIIMWGSMFVDQRINTVLLIGFVILGATTFALGRSSAFINDEGFLRSMIPHHSRAIQVCQTANLSDSRVVALCERIIESQESEIREMQELQRVKLR